MKIEPTEDSIAGEAIESNMENTPSGTDIKLETIEDSAVGEPIDVEKIPPETDNKI